jgi:hypothetical protein
VAGERRDVDFSRDPFAPLLAAALAGSRRRNGPPGCCVSGGEADSDLDSIMAGAGVGGGAGQTGGAPRGVRGGGTEAVST